MARIIIGIDPGAHGAVAVLTNEGELRAVHDLPNYTTRVGRTNRTIIDAPGLIALLASIGTAKAFVERVGPMPHDGAAAAFSFGYSYGTILTALASVRFPVTVVTPVTWRRAMGLRPAGIRAISGS